ncbi:hypothetical protein [Acidovorax sp.]|jgi:hypothetical protein|uniref:hypothetical protein n=1 Tax=Acidovorax sp. TaxID=1872122 RepID=UPI00391FBF44
MNFRKQCLRAGLVLALSLGALSPVAMAAQTDAERQAVILSMFKDGATLTEDVHREFWSGLKDPEAAVSRSSTERVAFALQNTIELERATLASYKASIQQRKPVVDKSYEQALMTRVEMMRMRKLSTDPVLAKDKAFRESLVPVSKGQSFEIGGNKVSMTSAIIDKELLRLDASRARLERLLNPVWTPLGN